MNASTPAPASAIAAAIFLATLLAPARSAFAEGSVNFNTGAATAARHVLAMAQETSAAENKNRYSVLRVYARAGETLQMGSSAMNLSGGAGDILVYPPGTNFASASDPSARANFPADPVFATDIFSCKADDPGTGRIASRAEELAGPAPNPGGYTPCEFTVPADGIYPVIMRSYNGNGLPPFTNTVASPLVGSQQSGGISIWDVTVRSAGAVQPGRLFSNRLSLSEFGSNASDTNAYLYTPAGYVYRVGFFKHAGQVWDMAANDRGVIDAATGARIFASFQWGENNASNNLAHTEAIAPQITAPDLAEDSRFPIFFQPPDPVAISGPGGLAETRGYATAPISPSGALSGLSFTGAGGEPGGTAEGAGGTIRFDSPPQMNGLGYTVAIDLNRDGIFGDADDVLDTSGDLAGAGNSFTWDGKDAAGELPPCGSYEFRVSSTLAEVHLTQSDVEESGGTVIERLSLPGDPALGSPLAASYDEIDPFKGTVVTNATPAAVSDGISGPGFHSWTAQTGNADFVDTWMRLPEVASTGSFEICLPAKPEAPSGSPRSGNPPTPGLPGEPPPPTAPPKGSRPPKQHQEPTRPHLVIEKTASTTLARPTAVVGYTIRVSNNGTGAARRIEVCDEPSSGLEILRSEPATAAGRSTCWKIESLAAGAERVLHVTARVAASSGRGVERNIARVKAANVKGVRADSAAIRVRPLPSTACGSRYSGSSVAPRC